MKIGICGKSGSGKSTVSKLIKERLDSTDNSIEYTILDLDIVGKEISNRKEVIDEISKIFGSEYITGNKILDRKKLGKLVFSSKRELKKLNTIFFKYIRKEIEIRLKKTDNIIVEGAILFEIDITEKLDKTIFVHSGKENNDLSVKRIMNREKNIDEQTAKNRIKIQKKYDTDIDLADIIIENSDDLEKLQIQIKKLPLIY